MPIIEWDKKFELGMQPFDEHHKHLVSLLNEVYDDFAGGSDREALGIVLDMLIDYAMNHFAAEELRMGLHEYPQFRQHCEEHDKFYRRIVEIQNNFHMGKGDLSLEVMNFLGSWLSEHILKSDADYGRFAVGLPPVAG
ncbi:bacteriohemerythrin [Geobacter sp. FeAm09]|uniref:bacteriohemerythrin n=1 Tax=Geobacter sp. FeAm09 TaxID=2597769 RepID=UPI0011EE4449|nr:bacteriohemerythrin [Geobacter sp. FeAm09]QEM67027.1 bacteriohemerythrin [Geobacter sp. FeAm09]